MADRTAWRICRDNRRWSVFGKKRGRIKKASPPVHDDLVRPDFTAAGPNRLWLADITEHVTDQGKLYLCAVKEVFSKGIVGYSIDAQLRSSPAVPALNNAVAQREDVAGCILHSDRASQFRSRKFVRALDRHRIAGSIGRVGAAGDHGVLHQPAAEERPRPPFLGPRVRTADLDRDLDRTDYHRRRRRRRRQTSLGRLTPVEFETVMTTPALQAA
jgi:transposase InsO family protein